MLRTPAPLNGALGIIIQASLVYFYVDESGHTGANLFDAEQPTLYYGVLSARTNIQVRSETLLNHARKTLSVRRLHAAELGNAGLVRISKTLLELQKRLDLRFDLYRVAKADHAVICFFDQVFDQGLNPAVTWTGYWTPLRYVLLLKVASLFDEHTLKKAWAARIELNTARANQLLVEVCEIIGRRVYQLPDERSRQIITDTLAWAAKNPDKLFYNVRNKNDFLQITPNVIGFQSVMHGIARRLRIAERAPSLIVVDQQIQFNKAQKSLSQHFAQMRNVPLINGPGLPNLDFTGMPDTPITFGSSDGNAGLELVDVYLWL